MFEKLSMEFPKHSVLTSLKTELWASTEQFCKSEEPKGLEFRNRKIDPKVPS